MDEKILPWTKTNENKHNKQRNVKTDAPCIGGCGCMNGVVTDNKAQEENLSQKCQWLDKWNL